MKLVRTNDYLLLSEYLITCSRRHVNNGNRSRYYLVSSVNYEINTAIKCFRISGCSDLIKTDNVVSTNLVESERLGLENDLSRLIEKNYYGIATILHSQELVFNNFLINGLSSNPLTNINENGAYKYVEFGSYKDFYNHYADSALFPITYYLLTFNLSKCMAL